MTPSTNGHALAPQPWNMLADPVVVNLLGLVANDRSLRVRQGTQLDPRRDVEHECGYPSSSPWDDLDPEDYQRLYERHPVAAKVVEFWPNRCWAAYPEVYDDPDAEEETPWEEAWKALGAKLRGNDPESKDRSNWLVQEEGNPLFRAMHELDVMSGIGQFGLALFGVDDGAGLDQPVRRKVGPEASRELLFVRTFPEYLVQAVEFDSDSASPRFGMPTKYSVRFDNPTNRNVGIPQAAQAGSQGETKLVHWSRCLHLPSDTFASHPWLKRPRLRAVLNPVLDLCKVYGAAGEGAWKAGFPGLSMETHPQMGGDVDVDRDAMRDMLESYFEGLQRYMVTSGMSAKPITLSLADMTPQALLHIQAICIQMDVAVRIFMGSERGELASSQDERDAKAKTKGRRGGWCTGSVVGPFVSKLVWLGCLPEPEEGFYCEWPDDEDQTEAERVANLGARTTAWATYVEKGLEAVIPPMFFATSFDNMTQDEACQMLNMAQADAEERAEEDVEKQKQMIEEGLAPDPTDPVQMGKAGPSGKGPPQPAGGPKPPATPAKPNPFK